jgi:hypothetical protein
MRKMLVFQHVSSAPLGTLDGQLREAGFRIRYVNFSRLVIEKKKFDTQIFSTNTSPASIGCKMQVIHQLWRL